MSYFYRFLTTLFAPLVALYLFTRKRRGKEDGARFQERLGIASKPRPAPPTRLVWCHGASVGEALSILILIKKLREKYKDWVFLVTTGTIASAAVAAKVLPQDVIHQYVPVDRWSYVQRFLNHWRPDLALWVESEIWPNMLTALAQRNIPVILLNGRISQRSCERWLLARGWIRKLLGTFTIALVQTPEDQYRFHTLGMDGAVAIGNLKYAAEPLGYDENAYSSLAALMEGRLVWLMASSHEGEEEIAIAVHKKLQRSWPQLLTLIAPRHPQRGAAIEQQILEAGLSCVRRSSQAPLEKTTQIYLADTIGEMGLFYRLGRVCCLAGSFTWGGHNPVEPAKLGCAVIFGPCMNHFKEMAQDMLEAGAALEIHDASSLARAVMFLLAAPDETQALAARAATWVKRKEGILDTTLDILDPFFHEADYKFEKDESL
ncbi:MAG: 3-deoxy-D-manno-octulosonic acid transferase [Alphaproteobacteria bacterium]|nr:3-deoxy-D-manno-octulosonic acid transferase [Alphaproteobacteria bacterium]